MRERGRQHSARVRDNREVREQGQRGAPRRERRGSCGSTWRARIDAIAARYPVLRRLIYDPFFRLIAFTYPAFGIDVLYALVYGVMGVAMLSPWCGTIAAFYISLSLMRFFVLRVERIIRLSVPADEQGQREWRTHRMVGVMLIVTTLVFAGVLVLLVNKLAAVRYPGYFVYAVATYTTYQVVYATMQFVRTRRRGEPIAAALRSIGIANMLLSLLSMQTALITAFGDPTDSFAVLMSGLTGGAVCVLIAVLGVSMVVGATRKLRRAA